MSLPIENMVMAWNYSGGQMKGTNPGAILHHANMIVTGDKDTPLYLLDMPALHKLRLSRALCKKPGPISLGQDELVLLNSLIGDHFHLGRLMIMGLHRLNTENCQDYTGGPVTPQNFSNWALQLGISGPWFQGMKLSLTQAEQLPLFNKNKDYSSINPAHRDLVTAL